MESLTITIPFPQYEGKGRMDVKDWITSSASHPMMVDIIEMMNSYPPKQLPESIAYPKAIVFLDGNIGSGKSTFLRSMHSVETSHNISICQEDVESFQEELYAFYNEKTEDNMMNLELKVLSIALKNFIIQFSQPHLVPNRIVLFERGVHSILFFLEANKSSYHEDNFTRLKLFLAYCICYINKWLKLNPHIHVLSAYLPVNALVCLGRVKLRDRPTEDKITIDYLEDIGCYHDIYFGIQKTPFIDVDREIRQIKQIIVPPYDLHLGLAPTATRKEFIAALEKAMITSEKLKLLRQYLL